MGNAQRHALPRERELWVKEEATFGTTEYPADTDAFRARTFAPGTGTIERLPRDDNRLTRSNEEQITSKQAPAEWTFESYCLPAGVGVVPDIGPFLKAAFGVETVGGSTVDYTLTDTQGEQRSYTIVDNVSKVNMTQLVGAIVQSFNIKGASGDPPTITIAGVAKDHLTTGRSEVNGAVSGGDVPVTDTDNYVVDSWVAFEQADGTLRDDNSGSGFVVTAVDSGAGEITVSPSPSGVISGDFCVPHSPGTVTAGSPLPGVIATLEIDHGSGNVAYPVLSYDFTLNNNHVPFVDEAGQQQMTDWVEDWREVVGQFVVRAREDQIQLLNKRGQFEAQDVTLTIGNASGRTIVLNLPTAEFGYNDVEYANGDSAKITMPLVGLGTKNEISLQFA